MKGLRLIRRMEAAGLVKWFPEDGVPVVSLDSGRLVRHWAKPYYRETADSIWYYDSPDAEYPSMGTNKKAIALIANALK